MIFLIAKINSAFIWWGAVYLFVVIPKIFYFAQEGLIEITPYHISPYHYLGNIMNDSRPYIIALVLILSNFYKTFSQESLLKLYPTPLTVAEKFTPLFTKSTPLNLPQGFRMNVFYAGLSKPRFFTWSPSGVLHVVDMTARAVYALPDNNRDGVADTALVVASPVDSAHSIAFYRNELYVTEPSQVKRFTDSNSDGIYETMNVFISGIHSTGVFNHYTRTILFDTVGKSIYLSVGASCNACREQNPQRATILRFNLDGTGRSIFATGLRNAIGLALEPQTGVLWAANADRNGLGETEPEEIITNVPAGSFHGFPLAYSIAEGNNILVKWNNFESEPEYQAMRPITRADSILFSSLKPANVLLPAHSTPMGIEFYTGKQFPSWYRNAAFIALHGSYDQRSRKKAVGYNVVVMKNDYLSGRYATSDFLTGFLTDSSAYSHWGRPCGIGISPNDDLFVSSDAVIGALYRITYTSPVQISDPIQKNIFPSFVLPNPVTTTLEDITIEYKVPEAGLLTCNLYNVRGEIIAYHEEYLSPDTEGRGRLQPLQKHRAEVHTNAFGLYFYHLTVSTKSGQTLTSSGKIMLIR